MAIYSVWASGPITNSYTWFGNNNTNLVPGATDWVYINYVQSPNNPPYTLTGNGTFGYLTVTSTVTFTNSQITVVGQDGPNEGNGYNSTDYDAVVVEGSLTFSGAGTSLTADEETWVSSVNTTSPASLLITNSATAQFQSALNANGQWTVALDLENGSATISGQGTSATTDNGLIVGDSGFFVTAGSASNSALTVSQGAAFEVGSSHGDTTSIGNALNTTGTITVTDANTTMTSDAGMEVGVLGTGTLDVVNTATLTLGASDNIGFYIGYGATGTGYFNLNTGAQVNGEAFADIGNDAGSYGDATIDGMNTTWTQTQDIAVGYGGFGILTVQNQATVTANALIAGVELGSWGDITLTSGGTITVQELRIGIADHGDITVDGTGSTTSEPTTLTVSDDATVGEEGDGYLTVQDGGQATITNDLTVGVETSGIGYVTVTGQDATGTNASTLGGMADFSIGDAGDAYVYVSAGGAIDAQTASVEIGVEDDSTGQLLVTDDDSSVDTADMTIGVAGDGTVLAENAGALTNTSVTLGEQEGGSGTVTLTDQETSWDISGDLTIGAAGDGTFSDSGADLSVDGDVILGAEDTGTGSLTLNAATPNFGSDMIIGEAGTGQVYVNQGSAMTVKSLTLGSQADSTGELDITGSTVQSDDLTDGDSGQGTIDVTEDSTLTTVNDATVGNSIGTDLSTVLVDTGSQWLLNGNLTIGEAAQGEVDIDNASQVAALGQVVLGDQAGAIGTVNVNGTNSAPQSTSLGYGQGLVVGNAGEGIMNILAGAMVAPTPLPPSGSAPPGYGEIEIAAQNGGPGETSSLKVDGDGSQLEGSSLAVGGTTDAAGGDGTLLVWDQGEVVISGSAGTTVWGTGTIDMIEGTLITPTLTIEAGGTFLSEYGTVAGSTDGSNPGALTNDGTFTALIGTTTISDNVTTDPGATGQFEIYSGATLDFSGTVDAGQTITFAGGNADLTLDPPGANGPGFNAALADFFSGEQITIDNFAATSSSYVDGDYVLSNGTTNVDLDFGAAQSLATLSYSVEGGNTIVTSDEAACYCRGTLIRTLGGDRRIETLKIGDKVMTMSGKAQLIKWIGKHAYHGRFIIGRKEILPICIKAGALDDNIPGRDLWISPHHAMYLDGVLIEAKDLVNGASIVQAERADKVEYFHIELETHDVIVAEGALSETFIDDDNRGMFHNAYEYRALYPDVAADAARYCAPRVDEGYELEAIRRRIALRAILTSKGKTPLGALRGCVDLVSVNSVAGWAQNIDHPEAPVCLDIFAGGRLIGQVLANRYRGDLKRAGIGSGFHSFRFTPPDGIALVPDAVEVRRALDEAVLPHSSQARSTGTPAAA